MYVQHEFAVVESRLLCIDLWSFTRVNMIMSGLIWIRPMRWWQRNGSTLSLGFELTTRYNDNPPGHDFHAQGIASFFEVDSPFGF